MNWRGRTCTLCKVIFSFFSLMYVYVCGSEEVRGWKCREADTKGGMGNSDATNCRHFIFYGSPGNPWTRRD